MAMVNKVYGLELDEIKTDYDKLNFKPTADGDYAYLASPDDIVYENIEPSPDTCHELRSGPECKCRNRKWIGSRGLIFTVVVVVLVLAAGITVTLLISRGDSYKNDIDDIGSTTINDNETIDSNTSQLVSTQLPVSSPEQVTTTGSLSSSTAIANSYWLPWNEWSVCSSTCGAGIQVRYRSCYQIFGCDGNFKEIQQCFENECPVYGSWSQWTSWTVCNVTCGEGLQIRSRTCSKVNKDFIDCVGKSTNEQICSHGACPDCLMTCKSGKLNTECNMCFCSQVLSGQVVSAHNGHFVPLHNVRLYKSNFIGSILTTTDNLGQFNLSNVCLYAVIRFSKEGFVDRFVEIDSATTNITLEKAELPYITTQPQTKSRMIGENVTLCCSASRASNITYYEWFKDSIILDENMDQNGTMIFLTNLTKFDKGKYSCRANNAYGSVKSREVILDVQDSQAKFCENAFESKKMKLPSICFRNETSSFVLEVGHCYPKLCRTSNKTNEINRCSDDTQNCCSVSDFKVYDIPCKDFKLSVLKVLACGCAMCRTRSIKIIGTVFIYPSNEVAKYFQVYLNGDFKTYTSNKGLFNIIVSTEIRRVVLFVQNQNGRTTTKFIDLPETSTGTVYTTIYVVDVTKTVQIDPSKEHVIHIGKLSNESGGSMAELHIKKYSFANSSFQKQTGLVDLSISYLDSKNITDIDVIPGFLTQVNENGDLEPIESFGSFHITAYDTQSKEVLSIIKEITILASEEINQTKELSLYKINTKSGVYELMPISAYILGFLNSLNSWLTIGRSISVKSKCFFRIHVFEHPSFLMEIVDNRYKFYLQTVHMANGSFKTYSNTMTPSSSCFETICDNTKGYIEMWVSNIETRSEDFLIPANPILSDDIGLDERKRELVQYFVSDDDMHLGILFKNTTDGPFFDSETACLASNINHFKFYLSGVVEDIYTFRPLFDVYSNNYEDMQQVSQRVWYQRRVEGYRVCFVKVKVVMESDKSITVRVTSFGGTNPNITNVILGVREAIIFESSTICIEYKCSGTIDEHASPGQYDFTRVDIDMKHSCSVKSFSQTLIDNFPDVSINNTNSGNFSFYAPTSYSPIFGIYSATTSSGDIESAIADSKGKCRSGKTGFSTDNPDIGVAVTFFCP